MRFLLPLILFSTSVGIFFLAIKPLYEEIEVQQERVDNLNNALANSQKIFALKDSLLQKYNSISPERLKQLDVMFPSAINNARLILEISERAGQSNLLIEDIGVRETQSRQGEARGAKGGEPHTELVVELNVSGAYNDFRRFLSAVESSLRIADIESISITANEKNLNEYVLLLTVYRFADTQ